MKCPECGEWITSMTVEWGEPMGNKGFLYFCPVCKKRIPKEHLIDQGYL